MRWLWKTFKRLVLLLLLVGVVGPLILVAVALEDEPLVAEQGRVTADEVKRAKALASRLKALAQDPDAPETITVTEADLDGAIAAARQILPVARGDARVGGGEAEARATLRVPYLQSRNHLNVEAAIAPSDQGLEISRFHIGGVAVPTVLVTAAARLALDQGLAEGTGALVFDRLGPVSIDGDRLVATVRLDDADRALIAGVEDRLRTYADLGRGEAVKPYVAALTAAAEGGLLPTRDSLVPWIRYSLALAADRADPENPGEAIENALFALAVKCGTRRFEIFTGPASTDRDHADAGSCTRVRLGGRTDYRQHFVVSAGIEALADGATSFRIGEIKELLDTDKRSGFSFDDLAADMAGLRFAERLRGEPPAAWREIAAGLSSEYAIMPSVEGLPAGLTEAQFARSFGGLDDPRYLAKVAEIEARVDRLSILAD